MAINASNAGIAKPLNKAVGILHYAPVGTDISGITATSALPSKWIDAGAITVDGITVAFNTEAGEPYPDWHGNNIDYGQATSSPTLTVGLLEVYSANAQALVYSDSIITKDVEGNVTQIKGTESSKDYAIIITTVTKNKVMRRIYPHTVDNGRGDLALINDGLISQEITRGILTSNGLPDQIILVGPLSEAK